MSLNRSRPPAQPRSERGAVAVLVALSFSVFVILVALVVDLGLARDTRRVSQNAADASALAGANTLYPAVGCPSGGATPCVSDAVAAVKTYALANFGVSAAAWAACSTTMPTGYVAMGGTSCIAFDSASSPTKVWVQIPTKNVQTSFASIIGKSSIAVGSKAEAVIGMTVKCSLCFLGSVEAENADFSVHGGSIAVNGNVDAGPNSYWTSSANGVVGTVNGGVFTPAPTGISPFSDPLASLPLPLSDPSLTVKTSPCGAAATNGPGIYNAPITLGNNVSCSLQPGLYVINNTWLIGNNTTITGTGVTIYVPGPNGYLNWKNGYVTITAPTTGTFKNLAVVYSRDNTNPISIQGNGSTGITGTVYAPAAALDFNGMSCFGFSGGPVVVAGVDLANGNRSCIDMTSPNETTVAHKDIYLNQ